MIEKGAVLPMFYLPPVEYFVQLNTYKPDILIEREEHFPKQTYRNRANIYSPEGILTLVVPITKGSKNHTKIKDVKISYEFNWQRQHWLSLSACYRSSAYFEYYEEDFARFYDRQKQITYLFEYNQDLLQLLFKFVKIKTELKFTDEYHPGYGAVPDFRTSIHPKKETELQQKPYFQVFEDRQGFLKNLSIVDLLFNQGPQSLNYL